MAAPPVVPADVSVQLATDVYQEQFDFIELVRDVTASIDSQASDDMVRTQVELLLAVVGRDLLKLHALIEVVNIKIDSQSSWATTVAVKFYRALFQDIDLTLELETFCDDNILGADIAGRYMIEAAEKFVAQPIWGAGSVNVLEFSTSLLRACTIGQRESEIAESLGCILLERMATSLYLLFNNNYDTFSQFAYKVVPLLDTADENMKSSHVTGILKALKKEDYERIDQQKAQLEQMHNILGKSELCQQHAQSTVVNHTDFIAVDSAYDRGRIGPEQLDQETEPSSELFTITRDWRWPAIERFLKSISEVMKIDAPNYVQTVTLDIIQVMTESEFLFLHRNLQILAFFIFSVAPALDGMADTPNVSD